jgi:putative nucleotidyltransferase with HDIG domain
MLFIPVDRLRSGLNLGYDVMVFERSNVRLLPKGSVLTDQFINRLKIFGISGVYVRDEITGDIVPSTPLVSPKLKTQSLNNLEWVFKNSDSITEKPNKQHIRYMDKTVLELIKVVRENEGKLVNIADLRAYDEYTYHHSLSVAVVALGIGTQLGLSHDELHKLGFSAIMHDIGKMSIPIDIINKPARLTSAEYDIIKQHPVRSENYLLQNQIDDPEIYESVTHHHEKVDGTGYPEGLVERRIPYYSKIISVADVYDALTSRRPYRIPQIPTEVAEYIMGNVGVSFDMDVVHAFLRKIEFFPVGSFVEFNDGRKGIVVDNENTLHPVVKQLDSPFRKLDLFNDPKALNLVITKFYDAPPMAELENVAKGVKDTG